MDVLFYEDREIGSITASDKNERLASLAWQTFSMDQILENVFSRLDRSTLFSCRFVSHRWAVLGSQEAQKQVQWMSFVRDSETRCPRLQCKSNRKLFVSDLISLMSSSTAGFPCNSFMLGSPLFKHPIVQLFLNVHGAQIKKLYLAEPPCRYKKRMEPLHEYVVQTRITKQYKQVITFSNLTRLLLVQCPHLENFACHARMETQVKENTQLDVDPNDLAGMVWRAKNENPNFKFNFKVFVMHNRSIFPEKLLQAILLCSPRLKKLSLEVCNLHCLVQPVNRLYLLETFALERNALADADCLKALEEVVEYDGGNWAIQILRIDGSCLFDKPHLWSRATHIINRILLGVSASSTCTALDYTGLEFLKGIRMPQMRTVESLSLFVRRGFKTLPGETTLGDAFPNLKSLSLRCKYSTTDEIYPLLDVFNSLQPLPRVENVHLLWFRRPEFAEGVKRLFPNAQLRNEPTLALCSAELIRIVDNEDDGL